MAELASGAVSALLGVIRDETQLLGGLENDVQFIKEEMESMNGFLQHLARTTPPGGEHDEQVRTWMKQVRDLASECSNCIDTYLQRGDPAAARAFRGRLSYLWRVIPWYLKKLSALRSAAIQLRELKDRARDVGERRLRYGVQIPTKTSPPPIQEAKSPSQTQAAGGGDEGIIPGDEAARAEAFREPRLLEECTQRLVYRLRYTELHAKWFLIDAKDRFLAFVIAAPDEEDGADVASEAWAHPLVAEKFERKFWINSKYKSLEPLDILRDIQEDLLGEHEPQRQDPQLELLDRKIEEITKNIEDYLGASKRSCTVVPMEPLDILHDILEKQLPKHPVDDKDTSVKITETAEKLKAHLERGEEKSWIGLDHSEYENILGELLSDPNKEATDKSDDDQITNNIKDIMKKMKEDKSVKEAMDDKTREDQMAENIKAATQQIIVSVLRESLIPKPYKEGNSEKEDMEKLDKKIKGTLKNIKHLLLIREAVENIKKHLKDKTTLIVLNGYDYVDTWENTKKALNMLECKTGSAVIVITRNQPEEASKFCNAPYSPVLYSLVSFYRNKVLRITRQRKKEEQDNKVDIYRRILKKCEPHEFFMKIFARALYVDPNRSKQELEKLLDTLVFGWEPGSWDTNARKMLKFSYSHLPREHKACLWYLAIFPRGEKIKRSSLVGRWVAEGLVTKEDWPRSVRQAERCFDELIDRCFVYPGDFGDAGNVKSCIVHDAVHEFITNTAKKEHFLEPRLSRHHARHFSVMSDLRIPSSDKIENFLSKLHKSPRLPLVKVLDLEGCVEHLKMKQYHLKNICSNMLLLKYLSLRNIHISKLPREINNLHQLEVLDIRQTGVDASTTNYLMLLKLKRLLAGGNTDPTPSTDNINRTMKSLNAVKLPRGIKKMTNMEVLSHVEASEGLEDIGKLWQLRKLGVVIHDKADHLNKLVTAVRDLSESLRSLSISIKPPQDSSDGIPPNIDIGPKNPLDILESLSIRGKTRELLLPLLVKDCDQLAKVTLYSTSLKQDGLKDLGKLPKLRCVRLLHESYTEGNLTFKKEEFLKLKYLLIEGSNMKDINFEDEAAPELKNIDLYSGNSAEMNSISFGNGAAPKLEKLNLFNTTITSIKFEKGATPELEDIVLSSTNINTIEIGNGAAPRKIVLSHTNIKSIEFGNGAAPKLGEIVLSNTNITSINFEKEEGFNLRKIVLSPTNMEFLSKINNLPGLQEVELKYDSGTESTYLGSLFTKAKRIAKVILRGTLLKQVDLQILAKHPTMRRLMLLEKSCDEKQLTFNKDEFTNLNLLIVDSSDITNISFTDGAAPNLEKIVWSFTEMESFSGIDKLPKLKELVFNGDPVPYQVTEDIEAHQNYKRSGRPVFKHNKLQKEDKAKGSAEESDDERRRFPFFWEKDRR